MVVLPTACAAIILGMSAVLDFIGLKDFSAVEGTIRIRYAKFAEMILTVAPLFWALAFYSKSFKKSLFFILAGTFAWVGVMFSLSRGAFLAGICGFIFFFVIAFLFSKPIFRRKTLGFAGFWLAITLFTQILFSFGSSIPATTDYLTGKERGTDGNAAMRIYTWKVGGQMISDNLLLGVGADNFGLSFNESRTNYAIEQPFDKQNATGEYYMFERAHNEFIQIFAELGFFGALIFALFFGGFAFFTVRGLFRNSFRVSPVLAACLAGLAAFLLSSLFSSFSFRAIQNGLVFFLVLAVASVEILKTNRKKNVSEKESILFKKGLPKAILALSLLPVILLAVTSFGSGMSQYYVYLAEKEKEFSNAEPYLQKAISSNPENASAYFSYGIRLLIEKQPEKANQNMQKAIENGLGVSSTYSYLTTGQMMLNDPGSAEKTMAEAIKIFPKSVFARVRYALILEQNGKFSESEKQLEKARQINERQTLGWYSLIKDGSDKTVIKARENKEIPDLTELTPSNALFAVLDDESFLNRFPDKIARGR